MCAEVSEGKFAAPTLPAAEMGWWIGEVLQVYERNGRTRCLINVLWSQNSGSSSPKVILASQAMFFDNMPDAQKYLGEKGVLAG